MTVILAIGGTDSSGGAGLTRDTAMAAELAVTVRPVVTAVTVQTDAAVLGVHPCPPTTVADQVRAALATAPAPGAVKIGMLGSAEAAEAVDLALPAGLPIVLDPVLKASSGGTLMDADGFGALLRRAALVTPNLAELEVLAGAGGPVEVKAAALLAQGVQAVLVKGGHGTGTKSTDLLFTPDGAVIPLAAQRLPVSKRGTGCSLATAAACHLAQGAALPDACSKAKRAVHRWLRR
ncbi:bifunctional hydroxymethylpyrimidine kinase/phosphomethylpyrimidine kinase [Leisingera sp. McT4-56]|uniref:bifunctional hydroxymethylpyrimidine kinase/phosphomethylpyrimidine kinase n=1 Tax=Leisingera sp. McT4-56 TaxID=2881255 RepID=UPI001CF8ADDB|nr:hydroxymethylpyrimidine/phosphomethylpyrimidine kinase [Leisingera sp. McT4-56]MCB4455860.1 hydroxymethylpyrimidine/phosphomethylpyrimidine kinase [Leisingera sp. McT4-56]